MIENPANTEENIENIGLPEESQEKFEQKEKLQSVKEKKNIESMKTK